MAPTQHSQPRQQTHPLPGKRINPILCIAIALFVLIVLVGLSLLITWLSMKPKQLIYTVESSSVQNYVLRKDDHLSATFTHSIKSYNPDRHVHVKYYSMEVSTVHRNQTVAYAQIPPFKQPPKNETTISSTLVSQNVALSSYNARDLRAEKEAGKIELDVYIKARVRYKVGIWWSKKRTLRAFCSPVLLNVTSGNAYGRTYCQVRL